MTPLPTFTLNRCSESPEYKGQKQVCPHILVIMGEREQAGKPLLECKLVFSSLERQLKPLPNTLPAFSGVSDVILTKNQLFSAHVPKEFKQIIIKSSMSSLSGYFWRFTKWSLLLTSCQWQLKSHFGPGWVAKLVGASSHTSKRSWVRSPVGVCAGGN